MNGQLVDGRISFSLITLALADEFRILLLLITAHPPQVKKKTTFGDFCTPFRFKKKIDVSLSL